MRIVGILVLFGAAGQFVYGKNLEGAISLAIGLLLVGIGQAVSDVRRRKARRAAGAAETRSATKPKGEVIGRFKDVVMMDPEN